MYLPTVWSNTENFPAQRLTQHTLYLVKKFNIKYKSKTMNYPSNEAEFDLNQQADCHFQMQDFKVILASASTR